MLVGRPEKGSRIAWRNSAGLYGHGSVIRTEGNLCWYLADGKTDSDVFIWNFQDGLNQLVEVVQ